MILRTAITLLIGLLTLAAHPSSAQEPTPFPTFPPVPTVAIPENPIITPITGIVYAGTPDGYVTFNPGTGKITPMPEELQGIGGILSPDGTLWAQWTASGAQQPVNTTQIMDLAQNEVRVVYQPDGTRDPNLRERRQVVNWSADSRQVMYSAIINQVGVYPPGTNGSLQYNFEIVDAMSGQRTTILEIPPMTLLNDIFPSPIAREGVILDFIHYNYWNPVYTEWIFVQPFGYGKDESGQYIGGSDAGIYNWATRQYISFVTLFPQTVISGTGWNADGSMMALNTMTGISVIHFSLDENGAPRLRLIADGINSDDQSVLNWLGVDNILITGTTIPYETSFIAQIIGDEWYSQEFLVYTLDPGFSLGPGAWRLTADEAEQKALRCLFVDRASAPIMTVGGRGQVAFTGGTPSRLRYLPGTDGSVAASLPEGTAFTVTGGPECAQGYRWWQIELSDGMVGWVAEGAPDDYWIEPLQN